MVEEEGFEDFEDAPEIDDEVPEVPQVKAADTLELKFAELNLRLAKIEKAVTVNQKYISKHHNTIAGLEDNFQTYIQSK